MLLENGLNDREFYLATMSNSQPLSNVPDTAGRFGDFGGRYVPETLTKALNELAVEYEKAKQDPAFRAQLQSLFNDFVYSSI